jgi:hypothetical protein
MPSAENGEMNDAEPTPFAQARNMQHGAKARLAGPDSKGEPPEWSDKSEDIAETDKWNHAGSTKNSH